MRAADGTNEISARSNADNNIAIPRQQLRAACAGARQNAGEQGWPVFDRNTHGNAGQLLPLDALGNASAGGSPTPSITERLEPCQRSIRSSS